MKLKFTRKTWYFFLLAAAAMSMLGGFAVLGGMDFSGLELIVFCITGIAVLFLAAQKGAPAKDKRSYTLVFVLLMLSKLAAGGWAGDLCSALVWPGLLAIEYGHGRPIQRPLQLVCISEALRLLFWLLTRYAGMSALAFWTNIMFVLLASPGAGQRLCCIRPRRKRCDSAAQVQKNGSGTAPCEPAHLSGGGRCCCLCGCGAVAAQKKVFQTGQNESRKTSC